MKRNRKWRRMSHLYPLSTQSEFSILFVHEAFQKQPPPGLVLVILHSDKKPPDNGSFFGGSAPGQGSADSSAAQGAAQNAPSSTSSGGGSKGATGGDTAQEAESGKSGTDKGEPTDEEEQAGSTNAGGQSDGGVHQCAVCKMQLENFSMSRPLNKSNCTQYGIAEASLTPDMRVCSSCRCRSVRRRYTQ